MRIVYLVESIYPDSGGIPRVAASLYDEMVARGHTVMMVCPNGSHGANLVIARHLRMPGVPEGIMQLTSENIRQITNFKPDIIHSHNDRTAIYYGRKLADALHIPLVHTLHADYTTLRPHYLAAQVLSRAMSLHARRLGRNAYRIPAGVVPDKADRRDYETLAQLASITDAAITPTKHIYDILHPIVNQLRYIPSGHDFAIRAENKLNIKNTLKTLKLITISRVVPEKRIDVLIRAMAATTIDAQLTIVGSGTHFKRYKRLAQQLNVNDRVHFLGHVADRSKLMDLCDDHDAFILGSYHFETQGMVLLEAAARGLPIIYCDERLVVGVNTRNSILTDPDGRGLAGAIDTFGRLSVKTRRSMAIASLHEAAKWPMKKTAASYDAVYQSLVAAK